jgi:hypothetical protein
VTAVDRIDHCDQCGRCDFTDRDGLCGSCRAKAPPRCAECVRLNRLCGRHQPAVLVLPAERPKASLEPCRCRRPGAAWVFAFEWHDEAGIYESFHCQACRTTRSLQTAWPMSQRDDEPSSRSIHPAPIGAAPGGARSAAG